MRASTLKPLSPLVLSIAVLCCGPPAREAVVHLPAAPSAPVTVRAPLSTVTAPEPPAPAGAIAWATSDAVARERAKTRGAPLLVFLFAEWATAAVRMDRTTWSDPRVIRHARSFIALRLDVSEADANAQVDADGYSVRIMPSTVLLDELGHELARLEGYAGPDEVLAAMGRVLPGN